jgi:U1 small nuclear ribonucleoprotein C
VKIKINRENLHLNLQINCEHKLNMPKYYCDYCDTFLTHDSPSVRKTHCTGRKHKDNVKFYYQKWMEEQAQHLIDATTAAFKAGKIASNPFATPPPGAMPGMPPRPGMTGFNPMVRISWDSESVDRLIKHLSFQLPPPSALGGPPGFAPPAFAPPNFSMPPHMAPRP